MTAWWQRGAIYQIYPRSFADSDGDGVGDLRGIAERLDHLERRSGVEAIWLSPFFPSPMADFGYDVADYCDVDPVFGTLADFDRLVAECHARGIKVVLDCVPNHTSDRHPWFEESRSSRERPKRDWYVWRDGRPAAAAERLAVGVRGGGRRVDARRAHGPVVPALVPARAARPELGEPGGRGGDARRAALLARPRRRRLPHRRRRTDRQGPGAARQRRAGPSAARRGLADDPRAPARHPRRARRVRRPDARRRGLPVRPATRSSPTSTRGDQLHLAHNFIFLHLPWNAAAFRASIDDVRGAGRPRRRGRRGSWPTTTTRAPPPASTTAARARARARGAADALRAARHAVRLPGRGARPARRGDPARPRRRPRRPRPRARADSRGGRRRGRARAPGSRPASRGCRSPRRPRSCAPSARRGPAARRSRWRAGSPGCAAASRRCSPAASVVDAGPDLLAWIREERRAVLAASTSAPARLRSRSTHRPPSCSPATDRREGDAGLDCGARRCW